MADFGDNFDQSEIDPAAEFLAREQAELGVIDDLKPISTPAVQTVNGDGAPLDVHKENSGSSFEMIDELEQEGLDAPPKQETNSELNYFDTMHENVQDPYSYENDFGREVSPSPPLYRQEVREEPEKIKKWREDQIQRLEEKDIEEEKKRLEWREIAKKELEDWYKNHEETIAKTKAANRNAEKQFVADDKEIEPGTEWERIAKLCDFNPKAKQGSKDVSRMRSLILQMKQSPLPVNSA
ncbi:PREDICTED: clathrin light chain isoform X2 [Nicrophorus vespilloides]|uniref:Clathrin light chain n=1 Tax=Nicrophorus vespilloides TaxID=110193 RepID=A0ABM1N8G7_NICVS|nr:PREDICTED: clathrin light chain isoform X2 [Nicrophorus vespilloides]